MTDPNPFSVAPTDAAEHNTIRSGLEPIAVWELGDEHFAFDSSVLLPTMIEDLSELIALVRAHPGAPLAVFGHADPTGDEGYNKLLSGRRAIALYAFLTRRVDLWERLHDHPMGRDDWKKNELAVRIMQTHLEDEDGKAAAALRGAPLFKRFMDSIGVDPEGNRFEIPASAFLGGGKDRDGKVDYQGCSEFNPVRVFSAEEAGRFKAPAAKEERDEANAVNRRVTVFLFRAGTRVDPASWPCPRATEGVAGCKKRFWSDAALRRANGDTRREHPADRTTFTCRFYDRFMEAFLRRDAIRALSFRVFDEFDDPVKDTVVFLRLGDVTLESKVGADGVATFRVPKSTSSAVLVLGQEEIPIEVTPLPGAETVAGVQQRLKNLEFYGGLIDGVAGPRTRDAVAAFQQEMVDDGFPLPINGDPADPDFRQALVREHGS